MSDQHELPTITYRSFSVLTSKEGTAEIPIISSSSLRGMAIAETDKEPVVIEQTRPDSLEIGDLLFLAVPLLPYKVTNVEFRKYLGKRTSKILLTLVDITDKAETISLMPDRKVYRIAQGSSRLAPWSGLPLEQIESMVKEDRLVYRIFAPIGSPVFAAFRFCSDLQCYFYSLKIQATFIGILFVLLASAIGLARNVGAEMLVAISIIGAFALESIWVNWKKSIPSKLGKGFGMRISFSPFGTDKFQFGSLRVESHGATIMPDGKPWFTCKLVLKHKKTELAQFTFANDIRGDLTYTCQKIADAIRHRIHSGSQRRIFGTTTKYNPEDESEPNISIDAHKNGREFEILIPSDETNEMFVLKLKRYQMRTLADAMEVMDQGRRL